VWLTDRAGLGGFLQVTVASRRVQIKKKARSVALASACRWHSAASTGHVIAGVGQRWKILFSPIRSGAIRVRSIGYDSASTSKTWEDKVWTRVKFLAALIAASAIG